jgi:hypothetical protein
LILVKGVLFARSSRLVIDKHVLGFRFPCDGPGRGGTCQVSAWDHVYLGLFWMYNCISVVIFHFSWKLQTDALAVSSGNGASYLTNGSFTLNSTTINGWLRDFLWSESSQVIRPPVGSQGGSYGLLFLGAHFVWAFSLMFLFFIRSANRGHSLSPRTSSGITHYLDLATPVEDIPRGSRYHALLAGHSSKGAFEVKPNGIPDGG